MQCFVNISQDQQYQLWWLQQHQLKRYQQFSEQHLCKRFAQVQVVRPVPAMNGAFADFAKQRGFISNFTRNTPLRAGQKLIVRVAAAQEEGKQWRLKPLLGADQSGETQSGETQSGETQSSEVQPGETRPGAARPGAAQPGAAQPGAASQDVVRSWLNQFQSDLASAAGRLTKPGYIGAATDVLLYELLDSWLPAQVEEIIVTGGAAGDYLVQVLKNLYPDLAVVQQNHDMLSKRLPQEPLQEVRQQEVTLAGGGFIAIEKTRALTAIDVNVGSALSNAQVDAFTFNSAAAEVLAQHILLRDISGLIVIDFVRMAEKQQKREIVRLLKRYLRDDWRNHSLTGFSDLGLVEMSRQHP